MTGANLERLAATIKQSEGYSHKLYTDTEGVVTVGWGRAIGRIGISRDEAELMFVNDLARVVNGLDMALPWWRTLDEVRQRALAEATYQLGLNGVLNFRKMRDALREGDYERAASETLDSLWHKQTPGRCERIAEMIRTGRDAEV